LPTAPSPSTRGPHKGEAGKAFADSVEDLAIKFQLLLLGGEKTVNEALRQALELQSMLFSPRGHKMSARKFWGADHPHLAKRHKTIGMLVLWRARPLLG
jgi:hypothetical protein